MAAASTRHRTLQSPCNFIAWSTNRSDTTNNSKDSLDREPQPLLQLLLLLILGQIQPIEACMAPGQPIHVSAFLDREPPRSITALQVLEAIDGHTRGTGRELEETSFALCWPGTEDFPEPGNDLVGLSVAAVVRELRPVVPRFVSFVIPSAPATMQGKDDNEDEKRTYRSLTFPRSTALPHSHQTP